MTRLEIIDRELSRVRESIDVLASDEVKQLIDELELYLYQQRVLLDIDYSKVDEITLREIREMNNEG